MPRTIAFAIAALTALAACSHPGEPMFDPAGQSIPWSGAVALLPTGQVEAISVGRNGDVLMRVRGWTTYRTKEPARGAVLRELDRCGTACAHYRRIGG